MAEILSSLSLTQLGLMLALVFFLTIFVLLSLLWYLRHSRLAREAEIGSAALAAEEAGPRIVLARPASTGRLVVEVNGREYASLDEIEDARAKRWVVQAAADLARFSKLIKPALPEELPVREWRGELRGAVQAQSTAEALPVQSIAIAESPAEAIETGVDLTASSEQPVFSSQPVADPVPRTSDPSAGPPVESLSEANTAAQSTAEEELVEQAFLEQLRAAEAAPPRRRGVLASVVPRPARSEDGHSFVVDIERILQRRAREAGLGHPVHIGVGDDGTLRVQWGGTLYNDPGDVPDPAVRELIRDSVGEWESTRV